MIFVWYYFLIKSMLLICIQNYSKKIKHTFYKTLKKKIRIVEVLLFVNKIMIMQYSENDDLNKVNKRKKY